MAARTAEELQTKLHEDRIWRRQELSSVLALARSSQKGSENAAYRAFWLLQYAHWEGFVKNSISLYIEFLCARRLKYKELKPGFLLFPTSPIYRMLKDVENSGFEETSVDRLFDIKELRLSKKYMEFSTESNLRFNTLKKISHAICLDLNENVNEFSLDTKLADRRNKIAHGEFVKITMSESIELRDECSKWMDDILDKIVDAASKKTYLLP